MSLVTTMGLADLAEAYREAWREHQEALSALSAARDRLEAADKALRASRQSLLKFMEEPPP